MIIGQEKPSLEEALEHFGVKGMKWGVLKKNRTGLDSIGNRLTKKSAPRTRSLVRNGLGFIGGQTAVTALTVGAVFGVASLTAPATVGTSYLAAPGVLAALGAGQAAGLIQMGMSAGITARDLAAISASGKKPLFDHSKPSNTKRSTKKK